MSKLIGIVGTLMNQKNELKGFGINAAYLQYFRQFGDVILIDPAIDKVLPIDLLVIPGGADIDTTRGNEAPSIFTGSPNPFFEWFDQKVLHNYIDACNQGRLGIWGTCRGSQSLARYFDVNVEQHIYQEHSPNRHELVDKVKLIRENQPPEILNNIQNNWYNEYKINSLHHQGMYPESFENKQLIPLGINKIYGNVEFFRHKDMKIAAGQHHPEECYDKYSEILINYLLNN